MKQELDPRMIAAAIMVLVVAVGFMAWRTFARRTVNVHKIQFGSGVSNAKQHMQDVINQNRAAEYAGQVVHPTGQ